MKDIYTEEEITQICEKVEFENVFRFKSFLANDYDLFETCAADVESNDEYIECDTGKQLVNEVKEIIRKIELIEKCLGDLTEDKLLLIISVVKRINVAYLSKKYKDKIDIEAIERLVEYGYTHGSCNSLLYTLCELYDECEPVIFRAGNYSHQCVKFNGKYYDITGCSTEEEMKAFVAKEGKATPEECTINPVKQNISRLKLLDSVLLKSIGDEIERQKTDIYGGTE